MSVVTFYNNGKVETGQTTSIAAISTYLSIEKNFKILLINANYNDTSLQECFWNYSKNTRARNDLETGIKGVIKALSSNKTSPEIITNYTRTIFKERLELLTDTRIPEEDFVRQKEYMRSIIRMANKYYDLVFIDLKGSLEERYVKEILQESNLVVINSAQRIKHIEEFTKIRTQNKENSNKVIYLIGKYDKYSKYNIRNLQRTERIQEIYGIPYNTLLFESCNEGTVADFIINYRRVKPNTTQAPVMEGISKTSERIIEKLKELQMQV